MADVTERLSAALADRYAIERELRSGGMATVYLAEALKHHRKVAVKVLRPELAALLGPERFLREIGIAAQLQHPHILPLHDSGEADRFVYYVMPYVEGESLRDRLGREGELPIPDVVRIMRDVADALTEAHTRGLVHCDIKPDNVLLRGRHAVVADFGVARAVSEATEREQLTTAGVALGTPAYMAPEQAAADPHIDHRADIYALGILGYELLAGHPPFHGRTQQMVLSAQVTEAPEPVTRHRTSVPPALARLNSLRRWTGAMRKGASLAHESGWRRRMRRATGSRAAHPPSASQGCISPPGIGTVPSSGWRNPTKSAIPTWCSSGRTRGGTRCDPIRASRSATPHRPAAVGAAPRPM